VDSFADVIMQRSKRHISSQAEAVQAELMTLLKATIPIGFGAEACRGT
jgi:hypothetical protein